MLTCRLISPYAQIVSALAQYPSLHTTAIQRTKSSWTSTPRLDVVERSFASFRNESEDTEFANASEIAPKLTSRRWHIHFSISSRFTMEGRYWHSTSSGNRSSLMLLMALSLAIRSITHRLNMNACAFRKLVCMRVRGNLCQMFVSIYIRLRKWLNYLPLHHGGSDWEFFGDVGSCFQHCQSVVRHVNPNVFQVCSHEHADIWVTQSYLSERRRKAVPSWSSFMTRSAPLVNFA